MATKKPTKNAPVPTDAELRQTIEEARACGSRGAMSRQPVLAAGAAAALDKLDQVRAAITEYYAALDSRGHGGIAGVRAFDKIQAALGMSWEPKANPFRSSTLTMGDR